MRTNLAWGNEKATVDSAFSSQVPFGQAQQFGPSPMPQATRSNGAHDLNKYRATLAHKINHHFHLFNCVFVPNYHPRFGLIAAAKSSRTIAAGQECLCHYNLGFSEGQPWYQELWRTQVDQDTPEGPYGHREPRKPLGQPIQAMLTDTALYKSFLSYATTELNLNTVT